MMMIMVILSTYNEWLSQAIYQFQHAVDIKPLSSQCMNCASPHSSVGHLVTSQL